MSQSGWRRDDRLARPAPRALIWRLRTWRDGGGSTALAVCALLFAAQLAWAAEGFRLEFLFSALFALLLLTLILAAPWARRAIGFEDAWLKAGVLLFLAVLVVGLLSLTPLLPGGAHPVWTYVAAPPAVALGVSGAVAALLTLCGLGCAFLVGLVAGRRDDLIERFFSLLVIGFALFAAWCLWTFTRDPGGLWGEAHAVAPDRLAGAYSSANTAALALGMGLILALGDLFRVLRRHGGVKGAVKTVDLVLPRLAPGLAAAILCGAALALTQSRAGGGATLMGLVALTVWESARRRGGGRRGLLAGAAVLALVVAFAVYRPEVFARLLNAETDFQVRRTIFEVHWRAFLASPWSGYGLGSFDRLNNLMIDSTNYGAIWNVRAAHNVILQWLTAGGLLGALPMFGSVLAILGVIVRGLGRRARMTGWLRAILCVSLVVLVASQTDYGLEEPAIAFLWATLLGAGAGLATR